MVRGGCAMGKMKYLLTIPLTPHFTPPTPIITHPHFTQPTPHTPILHTPHSGRVQLVFERVYQMLFLVQDANMLLRL